MEFELVDSLVFDEWQSLRIRHYHPSKRVFLMVTLGLEGRYFTINRKEEVLTEEIVSEEPNSFGTVLHPSGLVGDEIMLISDQEILIYDLYCNDFGIFLSITKSW